MKALRIILIGLLPLLQAACLWSLFLWPAYAFYLLAAVFVITDAGFFLMIPRSISPSQRFSVMWSSLFAAVTLGGALLFLDIRFVWPRLGLIAANVILQIIVLVHIYYRFYRTNRYHERSLARATDYLNTMGVFCGGVTAFALVFFLDIPSWIVLPILMLGIGLSCLQALWENNLSLRSHGYFVAAVLVALAELSYALMWLPALYSVNAALIAVCYGLMVNTMLASFRNELRRNDLITAVILAVTMIGLLIGTARWR